LRGRGRRYSFGRLVVRKVRRSSNAGSRCRSLVLARALLSRTVAEPFQLPFRSREERIAHNEAWARRLNERRAEVASQDVRAGFRCECWQSDCVERIPLSGEEWATVRAEPNRFAVAPGHVAESFEVVLTEHPGFWVIEKFGEAGKIAVQLAG
jgi:hypothetical protein